MGAAAAFQLLRQSHSAVWWSLPFAVILLFLAFVGDSPIGEAKHWFPDAQEPPER